MPDEADDLDIEDMLQVQPLIANKSERNTYPSNNPFEAQYKNFNDDEESTCILKIICMEKSKLKQYVVVPILALCTAFFFLLFLYWYPKLRKLFMYNECVLRKATHLFIYGTSKYNLAHFEPQKECW
jgi:hypothetical protein